MITQETICYTIIRIASTQTRKISQEDESNDLEEHYWISLDDIDIMRG